MCLAYCMYVHFCHRLSLALVNSVVPLYFTTNNIWLNIFCICVKYVDISRINASLFGYKTYFLLSQHFK